MVVAVLGLLGNADEAWSEVLPTEQCPIGLGVYTSFPPSKLVPGNRALVSVTIPRYAREFAPYGDDLQVTRVSMFFDAQEIATAEVADDIFNPDMNEIVRFWMEGVAGDAPWVTRIVASGIRANQTAFSCISDEHATSVGKPDSPRIDASDGELYLSGWCYTTQPGLVLSFAVAGKTRTVAPCANRPLTLAVAGHYRIVQRRDLTDEWSERGAPFWRLSPLGTSPSTETVPVVVKAGSKVLFRGEWLIARNYSPSRKVWEGTDEFHNYCVKKRMETTMSGGRLYCTRPQSLTYRVRIKST